MEKDEEFSNCDVSCWGFAWILQALILFILKDLKATMKELVRKDLCKVMHINVDRRIDTIEKQVEVSGVHSIPPVQRD